MKQNKTTEHVRRNYSQEQVMAYSKYDALLQMFRNKSASLKEAEKAPIFSLLHHSQVPPEYTEVFYLQKRWIMLSLIAASLSWKRGLTVLIRLTWGLCVCEAFMFQGQHNRTRYDNRALTCVSSVLEARTFAVVCFQFLFLLCF